MVDGKPLVICSRSGEPISVAQTSAKGFKKSTEQSAVWVVDAETGRLLPLEGAAPLIEIVDRGSFYRAIVDTASASGGASGGEAERVTQPPGRAPVVSLGQPSQDLLVQLQAVVAERRRTMPEGSYTTHLFREGVEKIRKKTGEEAVELILARSEDEIIYESADLIYHMIVLLQASGLGIEAVLDQLTKRMR